MSTHLLTNFPELFLSLCLTANMAVTILIAVIITLSPESALHLTAEILDQHMEQAKALSNAVNAQRAVNNNTAVNATPLPSSSISFPLVDAEALADTLIFLRQVAERRLEFK